MYLACEQVNHFQVKQSKEHRTVDHVTEDRSDSTGTSQMPKTTTSRRAENDESSQSAVPGVQKIKSSLRQTKRLLAKVIIGLKS